MIKNTLKLFIIGGALALLSTATYANIRPFSPSVVNLAGAAGYDAQLDTWDYINTPALYPELTRDGYSLGYYGNNNLGFGMRSTLGVPLYVAVQVQQNSPTVTDVTNTDSTNTTDDTLFNESYNNAYNVQVGTAFGKIGLGLFASINNTGQSGTFTDNIAGAAIVDTEWEFNDPSAPDKFGVNVGFDSGDIVAGLGLAYLVAPGSSFVASNGTDSIEIKNASDVAHTSDSTVNLLEIGDGIITHPLVGGTGLTAFAIADIGTKQGLGDGYDVPIFSPEKAANHYNGLELQSFGWLPLAGNTFGWIVHYRASTMLANDPIEIKVKDSNNNDFTATSTNEIGGLGHVMANLYYTIVKEFAGGKSTLAFGPDVTFVLDNFTVENTIEFTGTIDGTTAAAANAITPLTEIEDDAMAITLSLPAILRTEVTQNFDWIVGGNIGVTYATHSQKSTETTLAGSTTTEENSADGESGISISGLFTTGFQYRAADNVNLNAAIVTATDDEGSIAFANAGVSLQYFLGGSSKPAAPAPAPEAGE